MLQQVDFITSRGQELSLSLGDLSTGIILQEIVGLDPVKAQLVSTTFAMRDGTTHQAARRESRDIIVRMSLDSRFGGGSVAEIRRNLYSMFMSKIGVKIVFHETGMSPIEISGIIEDIASERFTDDPTFGMSIHCNDPDFINPVPFNSGHEGSATSMILNDIDYNGTVDSGIELDIDISGTGTGSGFVFQQTTPHGKTRQLIFSANLVHNDRIIINTHPGQKEVMVRRAGVSTSILYGIDPQSHWPMMEPGRNRLGVRVTGGTYQSYYELEYYERFGAI